MFKTIYNTISICFEGTIFRRAAKKGLLDKNDEMLWALEGVSHTAPYVLTQDQYLIKNDLISKLHSTDNGLQEAREESKRGRAKWFRDLHQQVYQPQFLPSLPDPQVEVYYRNLRLSFTRDPRVTFTGLMAR